MSAARSRLQARSGGAARESERRLILVGIDGSDAATNALEWSMEWAGAVDGQLVVLHALDTELVAYMTQHLKGRFHLDDWEREQRSAFEEEWSAPLAKATVPSRTMVMKGRPATVIMEAAERLGAEMVVVGRHGHRMVTRMLLGSVADELVHHCPLPVVVFPHTEQASESEDVEVIPQLEVKK